MKAWDCNGLALPSDAKIVGESEFESHLEPACVILFDHAPRFISDSSFLTSGAHETLMCLGTKALKLVTLGVTKPQCDKLKGLIHPSGCW